MSDKQNAHILQPLFGSYCRTSSFRWLTCPQSGEHILHLEAFVDDPIKKTWTVQLVDSIIENRHSVFKTIHRVETKTVLSAGTFLDVLDQLCTFENDNTQDSAHFQTTLPDRQMLGWRHFKAFAEREGYVFDTQGVAYARPDINAFPPDAQFSKQDIHSANNNMQRPADEFHNTGKQSKVPQTHFLLDHFRVAAKKKTIPQVRIISHMDNFAAHITEMHQKLETYCQTYQNLGKGGLVQEAEQALDKAESDLKQIKAYGLNVESFERFTHECRITCAMLHAMGIYDLMVTGKADVATNEAVFQNRLDQALALYKKIDPTTEGQHALEFMITHAEQLIVPPAIKAFLDGHAKARAEFYGDAPPDQAGTPPPPPPKPPGLFGA